VSDLPKRITIHEEGPREGFQIEPGPIAVADKIRFIEALAATGLPEIQCVSFVNPAQVPQMADADEVAAGIRQRPDVRYTGLWLNIQGLKRAVASPLAFYSSLQISASETFSVRNTRKTTAQTLDEQRRVLALCQEQGLTIDSALVMTAFGCNYEGTIQPARVVDCVGQMLALAAEFGVTLKRMRLADTVGHGSPISVARVIGAVQEQWPDLPLTLHLHDTRGTGLANALTGLQMGVASFESSCAGLGGCPFAGHKGAAGNICTEDLAYMAASMGIDTGLDLDALIDCARMAEQIVGHPLPGKVMHSGLGRVS
jgi:hydroxymethylglutaryl-CoA lyase